MRRDGPTDRQALSAWPQPSGPLQVSALTGSHTVESAVDIGALVRQERRAAAMTQQQLADRVGTTRQWVIRLEQGRHGTAMSTALVALEELGLEMVAQLDLPPHGGRHQTTSAPCAASEISILGVEEKYPFSELKNQPDL